MENVTKALDFMKYKKVLKYIHLYVYMYMHIEFCMYVCKLFD